MRSLSVVIFTTLFIVSLFYLATAATTEMSEFVGTWKLIKSENLDAFFEKLGVGWLTRKMIIALQPDMRISIDENNKWKIERLSMFRNVVWEFELNTPIDRTASDGREVISTYTFVDGKLIHVEKAKSIGAVDSNVTRSIDENDQLVTILKADDVVAKSLYERVDD